MHSIYERAAERTLNRFLDPPCECPFIWLLSRRMWMWIQTAGNGDFWDPQGTVGYQGDNAANRRPKGHRMSLELPRPTASLAILPSRKWEGRQVERYGVGITKISPEAAIRYTESNEVLQCQPGRDILSIASFRACSSPNGN